MDNLIVTFTLNSGELMEGYDLGYKLYRRKFTFIKAALFVIPFILFLQQVIIDPHYTIGYICMAVCAAAAVCIFATQKLERRNFEYTLEGREAKKYELTLSDGRLSLKNLSPSEDGALEPKAIDLSERSFKGAETENIFAAFTKSKSIVIPKSGLSEEERAALKKALISE